MATMPHGTLYRWLQRSARDGGPTTLQRGAGDSDCGADAVSQRAREAGSGE